MNLNVDFSKVVGKMKPMHAVNNGPLYKFAADQRITNIDAFREAGIPYQRTHDASFCSTYGGEHTIDIHGIFPNFDADPYDEASYDFVCTDEYLKVCEFAGVKTFYRLGAHIEHWPKKYNTLPPKDFKKWAIICEHIIRHYTEGWANGYNYDITYWEIWNEPDLDADDSDNKCCWGGTKAQFFELYHIAATHLKECFPHLKIGGPAIAYMGNVEWGTDFLKQLEAPLDFFSWHRYAYDPKHIAECMTTWRQILDENGYTETESILNEWNYVKGWMGDDWLYSLRMEKSLKGAAFICATMCEGQKHPLDLLMYYDARPCGMNGMFNTDFVCDKLKGYYPFYMFNRLYKLEKSVETTEDTDLFTCGAKNEENGGIIIAHYNDDDTTSAKDVCVKLSNMPKGEKEISVYMLDETNDCDCINKMTVDGENVGLNINMPLFSCCLIEYSIVKD